MNGATRASRTTERPEELRRRGSWCQDLTEHLPEYVCEAAALGLFMLSACVFGVLLGHPESTVAQNIDAPLLRRALAGLAMGITAVALIRSPLGRRSGAHMNPAVTIAYWLLGKVRHADAAAYIAAQFIGATLGVLLADALIGMPLRAASVEYVVTRPGASGELIAFTAEWAISFLMMCTVLAVSNTRRLSRYTPYFAGFLVALFITIEAPLSGMSMNPARTFASAAVASDWTSLWVYFAAPVPAMAVAAVLYQRLAGARRVYCARLDHHNDKRCIFNCRFDEMQATEME